MAAYVILRGSNVYSTGEVVVTAASGLEDGAQPVMNRPLGEVLEELTAAGRYRMLYFNGDPGGSTACLVRDGDGTPDTPVEYLESLEGTTVTITTDAGAVSGTLQTVGTDAVQLVEPTGSLVIIPIGKINTVEA